MHIEQTHCLFMIETQLINVLTQLPLYSPPSSNHKRTYDSSKLVLFSVDRYTKYRAVGSLEGLGLFCVHAYIVNLIWDRECRIHFEV